MALVAALLARKVEEAVEVSRKHVDFLHRTMFMGLAPGSALEAPGLQELIAEIGQQTTLRAPCG